ncbi:UNVERIFIED_CONTAM: hypothetical protein Q9R58_09350 [Methylobacteriaceae bacterium AG10]|nr:hypothetical protein [Methylobacteriaceae bacterium AG10]
MYKFILDRVYPSAPEPATSTEAVTTAIIEALVGHLYRLGYSVDEVRVPASLVPGEPPRFASSYGQFRVAAGLDAYGDNVITSALTGSNATTGNTASATVTADTVSPEQLADFDAWVKARDRRDENRATTSDDDPVKLIGETINNTISFGSIRTRWFAGPENEGIKTIAAAVLSKLRAEGVIR